MFLGRDEAFEWVSFFFFLFGYRRGGEKKMVVLQKWKQFHIQGRIYFFSLRFNVNGGKT